jgi:hypothetical protein
MGFMGYDQDLRGKGTIFLMRGKEKRRNKEIIVLWEQKRGEKSVCRLQNAIFLYLLNYYLYLCRQNCDEKSYK